MATPALPLRKKKKKTKPKKKKKKKPKKKKKRANILFGAMGHVEHYATNGSYRFDFYSFGICVTSFFKHAYAAIKWGYMPKPLSDLFSHSVLCVCELRRL